uniref:Uncharacterized protein n=1 Tax=Rhizophora mucronata TaxID=61149 RepID=A0A2P2KR55_RHIMU
MNKNHGSNKIKCHKKCLVFTHLNYWGKKIKTSTMYQKGVWKKKNWCLCQHGHSTTVHYLSTSLQIPPYLTTS